MTASLLAAATRVERVYAADMEPQVVERDDTVEGVESSALVEEELLVEEISIDGMCGVY
jgi:mycofactocin precursor